MSIEAEVQGNARVVVNETEALLDKIVGVDR